MVDYTEFANQMRPLCVQILESLKFRNNDVWTEHIPEMTPEALQPLLERKDVWFQVV